jgi:predicted HTH domain antitoxin
MQAMNVTEISNPSPFTPGLWRSESAETAWVGAATSNIKTNAAHLSRHGPPNSEFKLSIELPVFGGALTGDIVDLQSTDNYAEITFKAIVDVGVTALLTMRNEPSKGPEEDLKIKDVSLSFHASEHRARALFITDTLYSMLGLGGQVKVLIPSVNVDLTLQFKVSLSNLSELMQRRKMYFGLMVIEKATDKEFQVPEYISGEDMSAIFFAARAILDRQFIWRVNEVIQPTPASDETVAWFQNLETSTLDSSAFRLMLGPTPVAKVVLGQNVSLGPQIVFLEDAVIEDRENVRSALGFKDGRVVIVRIRPLSRVGRYVFSTAPTLPHGTWDQNVRQFIDLDMTLSQALIGRYLTLMSLIVPELPPEQMYTLINPETIALLAEQAHERQTPVDQYLMSLLTERRTLFSPSRAGEEQFDADEEFASEMRLAAAIHWYKRGDISQEKAAQVAGLDRTDFLLALAREGEEAFVVDFADLNRELQRG